MKIGDKIKARRIHLGLSQDELAKRLGYKSRSSINKIELGLTDISQSKIKEFAEALNTSVSYFFDIEESNKSQGIKIPVLGKVIAGIPIEAVEEILDYEEIDEKMARTGEFFALQIKGDSMAPIISPGDIIIIRKQDDVDNGQIGIILVNGDEATVKKVIKKENGIMLVSNNPAYDPMFFDQNDIETKPVRIIGKVVELRKKF